jgi:hypothetical protein
MPTFPQLNYLPLVKGPSGTAPALYKKGDRRGPILVVDPPRRRQGEVVYSAVCQCGQANCPAKADVDAAFLSSIPANSPRGNCVFQMSTAFVPYDDWLVAFGKLGINTEDKYAEVLRRGKMPKGSPIDPTIYPDFTAWSTATGDADYHSNAELLSFLSIIDQQAFDLMPKSIRYRFLAHQRYYDRLVKKGTEMGFEESEVFSNVSNIRRKLAEEVSAKAASYGPQYGPGSGRVVVSGMVILPAASLPQSSISHTPPQSASPSEPQRSSTPSEYPHKVADLTEMRKSVEWTSHVYEAVGGDLAEDTWYDWVANMWEKLGHASAMHGDAGVDTFRSQVLSNHNGTAKKLSDQFNDQYAQVLPYKVNGRNWMQAYALWYGLNNRRWINYSDAGIGKARTIPALVSALDISVTVYVAPLRIITKSNDQFAREVSFEDPCARIVFPEDVIPTVLDPQYHYYILVNPEKFQLGEQSQRIIDQLLSLSPRLVVYDEAHLVGMPIEFEEEEFGIPFDRPRSREIKRFMDALPTETRVGLMTGTPVRTRIEEAKSLLSMLGDPCTDIEGDTCIVNALSLRARLYRNGFRFRNYENPKLEQYVIPFLLPDELAYRMNSVASTSNAMSMLQKETERIPFALTAVKEARGNKVYRIAEDGRLETMHLDFSPLTEAINPVYFTMFVNGDPGPVKQIETFLTETEQHFYYCVGESDKEQLRSYMERKDGSLIASQAFSTGINGAHKVSDTLVTVGLPWHHAGHKQLVARLCRQGATKPNGEPTTVVREFIPVAINAAYDVRRFQKVLDRRAFSDCLLDGLIPSSSERTEHELKTAVAQMVEKAREQMESSSGINRFLVA